MLQEPVSHPNWFYKGKTRGGIDQSRYFFMSKGRWQDNYSCSSETKPAHIVRTVEHATIECVAQSSDPKEYKDSNAPSADYVQDKSRSYIVKLR